MASLLSTLDWKGGKWLHKTVMTNVYYKYLYQAITLLHEGLLIIKNSSHRPLLH